MKLITSDWQDACGAVAQVQLVLDPKVLKRMRSQAPHLLVCRLSCTLERRHKGKSRQMRHQCGPHRKGYKFGPSEMGFKTRAPRHPQYTLRSVDNINKGQQGGDVDPHLGNGFFKGQSIRQAESIMGRIACGSTVCSSSRQSSFSVVGTMFVRGIPRWLRV